MSVIGIDIEKSDPFDLLISEYGSNFPIAIELAINFESRDLKTQSKHLKNINKRTLKNLKKNKIYNVSAHALSEKPILTNRIDKKK